MIYILTATIVEDNQKHYLGTFKTLEAAKDSEDFHAFMIGSPPEWVGNQAHRGCGEYLEITATDSDLETVESL